MVSQELIHAIQTWALDHPAVFVSGMFRSGTTRLYAVLQNAPDFRRANGVVNESALVHHLEGLDNWRSSERLTRHLDITAIEPCSFDNLLAATRRWPEPWRRTTLVRGFHHCACQRLSVRRLAEKTPGNEMHSALLKNAFPRARFIYVLRHPIDVFASMRAVERREVERGVPEDHLAWWRMPPEQFASTWVQSINAALLMHEAMPGEVSSVRYEDFISDPAGIMKQLFAFVVTPFDLSYLQAQAGSENWGNWEPHLKDPIAHTGARWQDRITGDEAAIIQQVAGDMMARIRYAPYAI